jgi:hypothetical protein
MSSLAIGQSQLTTDFRAPRDSRWKSCEGKLNRLHVDERRMREGCGNEPMVRAEVCADDFPLRVRERVYHSGAPRAASGPCRSHLPDRTRNGAGVSYRGLLKPEKRSRRGRIAENRNAAMFRTWGPRLTYTITGPAAVTHAEMAHAIAEAMARPVTFVDVPPQAFAGGLRGAGVPTWQIEGLIEDYAHYARGEATAISPHVREVTSVEPHDMRTFARDYARVFVKSEYRVGATSSC